MSASYAATAAWGLVVLAAFVGWGGFLGARLFGRHDVDLGLRATWGLSLAVLVGGVCCLLGVGSKAMAFVFITTGACLGGLEWYRHRAPSVALATRLAQWKEFPGSSLLLSVAVAAAFVQYLASIINTKFNANDDYIAYFPFARQILEQGTLFNPFSTRRAMSFGGQSALHAFVLAGAPGYRLHQFDEGICVLIAALLVLGTSTHRKRTWVVPLALLLLVALPNIRLNTYPQMSGVVVFYGLYRTLVWLDEKPETPRTFANAAIVALVASAACTLRSNYIAVAVPMLALSYAHFTWKGRPAPRQRFREAISAAGFSFVFLLPWMLMSYRSSGTPLFPVLPGWFNDAFPMLQKPANWRQQWADFVGTITENRLMRTYPLLFFAGLLMPDRSPRRPLLALLLAGVIGWVALVHVLASDIPNFERYVYGFLVAGALAVTTALSHDSEDAGAMRRITARFAQTVAVLAVLMQLYFVGTPALAGTRLQMRRLQLLAWLPIRSPDLTPDAEHYRALQARVPRGATLLVMVDYPFYLDYRRNPIYNIDTAAAVSPPPGMPYFRGPDAVASYLHGQSIRYLAFVKPQRALSLYRRTVWERQGQEEHALWRAQAPVYLDMFDNFASLSATHRHLYEDEDLVLLDLEQRVRK